MNSSIAKKFIKGLQWIRDSQTGQMHFSPATLIPYEEGKQWRFHWLDCTCGKRTVWVVDVNVTYSKLLKLVQPWRAVYRPNLYRCTNGSQSEAHATAQEKQATGRPEPVGMGNPSPEGAPGV